MNHRARTIALLLALSTGIGSRTSLADPEAIGGYTEGGLTSVAVATRALRTSSNVQARSEQLRAAAAKLDEAVILLLPRVTGVARYTRLSDFDPPPLTGNSGSLVATQDPPGTVDPAGIAVAPPVVANILDNYLFQATVVVPLSDYPARLLPLRAAAKHEREAAQYDLAATQARSWADARIAFYSWLRARGAEQLAADALAAREAHAREAQVQLNEGNLSRPDQLRTVTALHAAKLALARAQEFALVAEDRVRMAMHAKAGEALVPGERLEAPLPAVDGAYGSLSARAKDRRHELRSLREQSVAAERSATAAGSQAWPALSAFGDVTYANPNPRRFPPQDRWAATWAAGVQLTISLSDIGTGSARRAQESARASALSAQVKAAEDSVELEVNEALRAIRTADDAIATSSVELENAREAYGAATALFKEGRFPSALLSDAEEDLTRARLELLNARVDARIGRVRLAYALGDDVVAPSR